MRSVVSLLVLLLGCAPDPERPCEGPCDADGDGFRSAAFGGRDCDDTNPRVHPDAREICNAVDDDCDGATDDADPDVDLATAAVLWLDRDGDGFGSEPVRACAAAPGRVTVGGDCDDASPQVHPAAVEVCNAIDDDCDGLIDTQDPDVVGEGVVYFDFDHDGFGTADRSEVRCPGPFWSVVAEDCDDTRDTVFPGAPEGCDGLDSDCDGVLPPDEVDGDGDGDPTCSDCDDDDPSISSIHEERCDGDDDDCDGLIDEADPDVNPYSCGPYCPANDPAALAAATVHLEAWNPCLLDPASVALCSTNPKQPDTHFSGKRLHRVLWREDFPHHRDELMLFLPPGPGRDNDLFRSWAAFAGYRVVSLGWSNDETLSQLCAGPWADDCYGASRAEAAWGVDASPVVDVAPVDSIEHRLSVLLAHLAVQHPTRGFGDFVAADGSPVWERIVVAGWSEGAAQAAFLAHHEPLAGVLLLSAPKDHVDEPEIAPVAWVTDPMVVPGCAIFTAWHVDEPFCQPPLELISRAWDAMGIPPTVFDLDLSPGATPPAGTHRVAQSFDVEATLGPACDPHASTGSDQCLRAAEAFPAYLYLLCAVGDADPATCPLVPGP